MSYLLLVAGLALLIIGAEALVRGSSKLAAAIGISPLVVGLTVVAYGTSAPEMAVSVIATLSGQGDMALGNVVGSNIFNVLFILGISAVIAPLAVSRQLVQLDVPIGIAVSLLLLLFALDGKITRFEGVLLFAAMMAYTSFLIHQSWRESKDLRDECTRRFGCEERTTNRRLVVEAGLVMVGLALLILGTRLFIKSAVLLAQVLGVSELIIGLTLVAAGTSLPEMATSIIASIRNEREIAVGNVIGSNLFNILAVLGVSSIVSSDGIRVAAPALRFDIPVMIAVAVACLPVFFTGHIIQRWEGALFLGYYLAYTTYLILASTHHASLPMFSRVMLWFVIPLTGVTLITLLVRFIRAEDKKNPPHG